jgi:lysozyme
MSIPKNIIEQLDRDEGFRSEPYKDSLGFLTIGHGFLIEPGKGGFSREESMLILNHRAGRIRAELDRRLAWFGSLGMEPGGYERQGVLVNMAYNLGVAGLMKFGKTLAAVSLGEYDRASVLMLDSKWAKQVGARAKRLSKQMATGTWQ